MYDLPSVHSTSLSDNDCDSAPVEYVLGNVCSHVSLNECDDVKLLRGRTFRTLQNVSVVC